MEQQNFIEQYFIEEVQKLIGENDIERARQFIQKMKDLENIEQWRIIQSVLRSVREGIIKNFENSSIDLAVLTAYKESLSAIDFLINLPSELIKITEQITLSSLTKTEDEL